MQLLLERALAQQPGSPAVLFSLAQLSYQGKQPDEARRYLQRYVDLPRSVPGIRSIGISTPTPTTGAMPGAAPEPDRPAPRTS